MSLIVAMFEESGYSVTPWAQAGHTCVCYDIKNTNRRINFPSGGSIQFLQADLSDQKTLDDIIDTSPHHIMGYPPCTDLAVSGARHFARKFAQDPQFQIKAAELFLTVEYVGRESKAPWYAENPRSVMSTLWGPPDFEFHPYEFGGYLPIDDLHPEHPKYIAPRDAYLKLTCLWAGNGWGLPPKMPVIPEPGYSRQHRMLGGNTVKTQTIRSKTPRGFAIANFLNLNGKII